MLISQKKVAGPFDCKSVFLLQGAFIGMVATHVIGVIRLILEIVYPVPHCGEPDNRPVILSKIHSFYFSHIMMLIQVILVLSISMLTQPRLKEEVIFASQLFYNKKLKHCSYSNTLFTAVTYSF